MAEETRNRSIVWMRRNKWIMGVVFMTIFISLLVLILPIYLRDAPVIYVFWIVVIITSFLVLIIAAGVTVLRGEFEIERKFAREIRANRKVKVDIKESFRDWKLAGGLHPMTHDLGLADHAGKAYGTAREAEDRKIVKAEKIARARAEAELAIKIREDTREYTIQKDIRQLSEKVPRRKAVEDILSGYINTIGIRFMPVPRGEFTMGDDRRKKSSPARKVRVKEPYYMSIHTVTQEQWQAVMGDNPSKFKDPFLPVTNVSHDDVLEFLKMMNEKERTHEYQLPSEAQWEYACRAGSTGRFCFGDDLSRIRSFAWLAEDPATGKPHPVGLKDENALGLFDMHGNVWEWCRERWHDDYRDAPAHAGAWMKGGTDDHVIRGGSYDTKNCECANRERRPGDFRAPNLGFRVIMAFDPLALLSQGSFSFVKK